MGATTTSPGILSTVKTELDRLQRDVVDCVSNLQKARDRLDEYRRDIADALGVDFSPSVERRRSIVLDMWHAGESLVSIASAVGVATSTVKIDLARLEKDGLLPLKTRSPDDEETIRRNHIIRLWRRDGRVNDAADVAKALRISVELARDELSWLEREGHIVVDHSDELVRDELSRLEREGHIVVDHSDELPSPAPPPPEIVQPPKVTAKVAPKDNPPDASSSLQEQEKSGEDDEDDDSGKKAASRNELEVEVARQQGGVRAKPAFLLTTTKRDHTHSAKVDRFGDGQTEVDSSGHVHRINKFLVCNSQGHGHDLTTARPQGTTQKS